MPLMINMKIQELCTIVDGSNKWTFHLTNEHVARYILVLPTQHTSVDCGEFVVLYLWTCVCKFMDDDYG